LNGDFSVWERTESGLVVPAPQILVPKHMREPERPIIRAVDLFCGCGGFSLGMQQAGIDVVAAVEWEPNAAVTYLANLGSARGCAVSYVGDGDRGRFAKTLKKLKLTDGWIGQHNPDKSGSGCRAMIIGDVAQVDAETIQEALGALNCRTPIDLVFGGPPCQGFSRAGKQDPTDARNNLVLEFVRIADDLGADTFVMENVPPLMTESKFRPLFNALVKRANDAGFDVVANVLDAANYGVPQRRRRTFVVGTRGKAEGRFQFPIPTHWCFGSGATSSGKRRRWNMEPNDQARELKRKALRKEQRKARKRGRK